MNTIIKRGGARLSRAASRSGELAAVDSRAPNEPKIESGIPCPEGRYALTGKLPALRAAIKQMNAGDSFLWPDNKQCFRAAREVGLKVTTRKINGSGYRVWRLPQTPGPKA